MLVSGVHTWTDLVSSCDSFHGVNVTVAITRPLFGVFGIVPRFLGIRLRQSVFLCDFPGR